MHGEKWHVCIVAHAEMPNCSCSHIQERGLRTSVHGAVKISLIPSQGLPIPLWHPSSFLHVASSLYHLPPFLCAFASPPSSLLTPCHAPSLCSSSCPSTWLPHPLLFLPFLSNSSLYVYLMKPTGPFCEVFSNLSWLKEISLEALKYMSLRYCTSSLKNVFIPWFFNIDHDISIKDKENKKEKSIWASSNHP